MFGDLPSPECLEKVLVDLNRKSLRAVLELGGREVVLKLAMRADEGVGERLDIVVMF
jgi:hypothetical protein